MFFRKLLQSFVRACKNGFKGFIEWIRSLLKTEGKHLDEVLDDIGKNLDSIKLNKLELDDWIKMIRKNGADVKVYTQSKKMTKYFKQNNVGASFDPWEIPPVIWIRKDVTDLELFHESMHLEDFMRRGKKNILGVSRL